MKQCTSYSDQKHTGLGFDYFPLRFKVHNIIVYNVATLIT